MMFWQLAWASILNRKGSALLTLLAMTVSIYVLIGVEHIRHQAKNSFGNTVSGIDLIVGARTGEINLLLSSVFHIGNASNNISWNSYKNIADNPNVAWTIPIALGDSHQGFRVMGTSADFFKQFRYGADKNIELASGEAFDDIFDVVLGSQVASALGYQTGQDIVLSHGVGKTSFSKHDDMPFNIRGILKPTGTPIDRTLLVSLQGIEAIHVGWNNGVKLPGTAIDKGKLVTTELTPKSITAFMLGLKSKLATFRLQRNINTYRGEPLTAILPGVALSQLWQLMSSMESTLRLISVLVLLASLLGLAAMLLASIRERQREIAILRTLGASPWFVLAQIEAEAILMVLASSAVAFALLLLSLALAEPYLSAQFGLFIERNIFSPQIGLYLLTILLGTLVVALIPGISAYRNALHLQLSR